jgi:hypothetical protein
MALTDALKIFDPEHFLEWKQTVRARILTNAEIEVNVFKMDRLDELLVSKIGGEYHTIPYLYTGVVTGMVRQNRSPQFSGTMAQLFCYAPNHVDRYSTFSPTRGTGRYAPGLNVQKGFDGSRPESSSDLRLARLVRLRGCLCPRREDRIGREAWGHGDTNTKHVRHIAALNVRSVCAENRNSR